MTFTKIFVFLLLLFPSQSFAITINKGFIDLSSYNFQSNNINLDGEWEFYWSKFLFTKDFLNEKNQQKEFLNVPKYWNSQTLTGNGYATLRLNLKIVKNKHYGILIKRMRTAYTLYLNGELILFNGTVGNTKIKSKPGTALKTYFFKSSSENIELILHVSNFDHKKGGVWKSIILGEKENISRKLFLDISFDFFIIGAIFIMFLYHFFLFFLRKEESKPLLFSLLCLILSSRQAFAGESLFIYTLFPSANWYFFTFLEFSLSYLMPITLLAYCYSLYPRFFSKNLVFIIGIIISAFILLNILTEPRVYSEYSVIFQIIYLLCLLYIFITSLCLVFKKIQGSIIFFIGFFVLAVAMINELLLFDINIQSISLIPFGLLFLTFSQSFLLSRLFAIDHQAVEKNVIKRTSELKKALDELETAKDYLIQNEKMAVLGRSMGGFAHEVNTPIACIKLPSEMIFKDSKQILKKINENSITQDELKESLEDIQTDSKVIYDNCLRANEIVSDFKSLVYDTSNETIRKFNPVEVIINTLNTFSLEIENYQKKYKYFVDVQILCDNKEINCFNYSSAFSQIVLNLVNNAFLHAFENKKEGIIQIDFRTENEKGILIVKDNGVGIEKENFNKIYDPFFTTKLNQGGTGLGLSVVYQNVIRFLKGEIICTSNKNEGTEFKVIFPLKNETIKKEENIL